MLTAWRLDVGRTSGRSGCVSDLFRPRRSSWLTLTLVRVCSPRKLIVERVAASWPRAHVAEPLGVSRATACKWLRRHAAAGPAGRSRRPGRWLRSARSGPQGRAARRSPPRAGRRDSSSTLEHPRWSNATVLKGDVVAEVSKLKQELDGEMLVYASYQLVRTLMEHDLVDELLPGRARGWRAPLRRDQRQEAPAPPRHPDRR